LDTTYAELLKKLKALEQQTEAARKREIKGVVARLREAIATYDIRAEELYPDLQKPSAKPRKGRRPQKVEGSEAEISPKRKM